MPCPYGVAHEHPLFHQLLDNLFHEERRALSLFQNELFKIVEGRTCVCTLRWAVTADCPYRVAEQRVKKFFRFLFPQWRQPQLRVIRLLPPCVSILWTIVHQQKNLG